MLFISERQKASIFHLLEFHLKFKQQKAMTENMQSQIPATYYHFNGVVERCETCTTGISSRFLIFLHEHN